MRVVFRPSGFQRIDDRIGDMLGRVADAIAADSRRYAPVKTGLLRDSIYAFKVTNHKAEVRAAVHYAAPVELGHRIVTKDGRTVGYVKPQAFLRPATYQKRAV